jgi:anti-sigma factor RsiW
MTWMRCVQFTELVTDWQEGALSDEVRAEVEEHLGLCPDCVDYVEQIRATISVLRGVEEAPPEAARAAALEAFRARKG